MNMKKIFALMAVCAAAMVSCQVNEKNGPEEPEVVLSGVPMTLHVDFAGTKTTYSPTGPAGFYCEWEAGDKVSVISFDYDYDYANVVAIDNFEIDDLLTGSFSGTYTGGSAPRIMVIYPHLEAYEGSASGKWGSEALNGAFSRRLIDGVKIGENSMALNPTTYVYSDENADIDILKERSIFYGKATIAAGAMTATLQNLYSVLTVTLDFRGASDPGDPWDETPVTSAIKTVEINADHSAFENISWCYPASFKEGSTSNLSRQISYFGAPDSAESDPTGLVPPTRVSGSSWLKYYIVGNFVDQKAGYKWNMTATTADGNTFVKELTFNYDYAFAKGSGAAFSATLTGTIPALPTATELDADGSEPSNCYIVPCTASTYSFSTKSKAGIAYPGTYNASYSAAVLWESLSTNNSVEVGSVVRNARLCSDNRIYVETTGTEGNAVVAIVNGEGTIVWSWHLWVTNYDPNNNSSNYNYITLNGDEYYYMMRRNLGAFHNSEDGVNGYRDEQVGLYYQFGRKDPFVGVNDIYEASVNRETTNSGNWAQVDCGGLINLAYARSNPMTFIKGTTASKSWLSGVGAVDGLWGTATKEQDPCPYGWRVADTQIWGAIRQKAERTIDGSDVNFWGTGDDKRPISKTIAVNIDYSASYNFDGLTLPYCGFYYYNTGESSWSLWQNNGGSVDVGDAKYWGNSMLTSDEAYIFSVSSIDMYQFETSAETERPAAALQVRCIREP